VPEPIALTVLERHTKRYRQCAVIKLTHFRFE
jgi:hypothetical protein